MKKTICALLCVVMLLALIPCLPLLAGTAATPLSELNGAPQSGATYSISNAEELKKFASLCTAENNWCEGVTFIITEDIDLNEGWTASATAPTGEGAVSWTPISMFRGVLDGQNHTLSGFYVADSIDYKEILGTGNEHASGIFCILSGTTCAVKNLNIENSYIHSQKFAGTIAGVTDPTADCNGLTISNVSSSAIIDSAGNGVGGILGIVFNVNTAGTVYIKDSEFSGEVRANNQMGGFVGTGYRNINITNCVNSGKLVSNSHSNIGGIYGAPQGGAVTITGCVNEGEFVLSNKNETNVGGIVGYFIGTTALTVDSCVNNSVISCNAVGSKPNLGGIVGISKSNNATIKNCVNLGDIVLTLNGTLQNHEVGGIIGRSEGNALTVNNCANFGDIKSEDQMGCAAGGIVGSIGCAVGNTNAQRITDCLSAGDISIELCTSGGIIGVFQRQNLTVSRCVFLGNITKLAAGTNGAYGGTVIGNVNNSTNITFEDCYFNRAYKPMPTWVGVRADYGKADFTVKATGKNTVTQSYTAAANPSAISSALTVSGALPLSSMVGASAMSNLTAFDWSDTANGWTTLAGVPMPRSAASLISESDVPAINSGSNVGGSGNQPDDESLVKKVIPLNSNTAGIKVLGVRHLASDSQINCDWTGSGLEMNIVHEGGDIVFFGGGVGSSYFRVYIDDVEALTVNGSAYHLLSADSTEIVLADVPAGVHNIKVIKVTGYTLARMQIYNVEFAGSIQATAPADKELYIEYVGDSISCGWGTIGEHGGAYTDQDGTLAYPLMVSDRLGADWSVTALSGQGLCVGNPGVTEGYLYGSALRSKATQYAFERKADAVVINIGTNDYWNGDVTEAQFKAAYKAFLETVKAKNGEDCKILCLYNTMNDTYQKSLLEVCAELGGESAGIYTYKTIQTKNGLHPNIDEQKTIANAVVDQLADILDIPYENIGDGIFGDDSTGDNTGDDNNGGNTDDNSGGNTDDNSGNGGGTDNDGEVTLPDKFDPSLVIGGDKKPNKDTETDTEVDTETDIESDTEVDSEAETETEVETETETEAETESESEQEVESESEDNASDGNGRFPFETILAVIAGLIFLCSLTLNVVLICILLICILLRKKKKNV